jgi:beta-galactosidase
MAYNRRHRMELEPDPIEAAQRRNPLLRSLGLLVWLLSTAACAAAPDWENERVLHLNTEPPRAAFIPFSTVAEALTGDSTTSPFYRSLDGAWKFHWVGTPEERPADFFQTNFDDSTWTNIDVP